MTAIVESETLFFFWAGFYPGSLTKLQSEDDRDPLVRYWREGSEAYRTASQFESEHGEARTAVLERLSDQFQAVAYGLREVRTSFFNEGQDHPGVLIIP